MPAASRQSSVARRRSGQTRRAADAIVGYTAREKAKRMSKIGCGYGSEWHLLRYLGYHRSLLSQKVGTALGAESVTWLDFPFAKNGTPLQDDREFQGLEFLADAHILEKWAYFWPQRGNVQNWDAVGKAIVEGKETWVLVEAKAHVEEVKSRCGATSPQSRAQIMNVLAEVREHLRATGQPLAHWLEPYYQFANRLAVLYFLEREGIAAHLVNLYFYGERARPGWQCPQSAAEWEEVIRDEEAWLGIARDSGLMKRVHHVFLAVNPLA